MTSASGEGQSKKPIVERELEEATCVNKFPAPFVTNRRGAGVGSTLKKHSRTLPLRTAARVARVPRADVFETSSKELTEPSLSSRGNHVWAAHVMVQLSKLDHCFVVTGQ